MAIVNILDSGGAYSLASAEALDLLISGGRRVVITDEVLAEILGNTQSQYYGQISAWIAANSQHIDNINTSISDADLQNYVLPKNGVRSRADASIAKYIEELSVSTQVFELVSDNRLDFDGSRKYKLPDRVVFDRSTEGFIRNVIGDLRISEARATEVVTAMRSSPRLNNMADKGGLLPSAQNIRNFYSSQSQSGWLTSAQLRGIRTSAIFGVGLEFARQIGVLGDVLSFGVTAAHAADLKAQGDDDGANKTWLRYIFETSGGVAGGAVGAAAGIAIGSPLAALAGAIFVGYAAGEYGGEFADFLYENYQDVVLPGLDQLNTLIDAALSEDDDTSRKFAQAVVQGLGFDYSATHGGAGNDWMMARGMEHRNGGAGDDILLGFAALHLAQGEIFDAEAKALADQIWAEYDAKVLAGENPELPDIDRSAGVTKQEQRMRLDGGAGDDWILLLGGEGAIAAGGEGNDIIALVGTDGAEAHGGADDDTLVAGGIDARLFGGDGEDRFFVGSNTIVEDADAHDTVYYGGIRIFGGAKQWWMEGNTAYWAPFSTVMSGFPVIGSQILTAAAFFVDVATMKFASYQLSADGYMQMNVGWGHGGTAAIKDYRLDLDSGVGSGGVTVFQHEWAEDFSLANFQQYVNLALKSGFGVGLYGFDPVVLDLDGDGYELTTEENSQAYFEFDGDGFGERTGWVRPDDGLLSLDINANGAIDGITELFGNQTTSGFVMLAAHDSNLDGVINSSDAIYSELRVWRDANQDGVSDLGELSSLADLGIVSISLANTAPTEPTSVGGNVIARAGSFTRANGTTGNIADVAFTISETATRWLGDNSVSTAAAALPELRGFGEVKNLRVAMTGDATLEGMVGDFAALTTNDLAVLRATAEAILYRWASVDGVAANAIGATGFDARKLAFLEKYSGYELMPRDANDVVQTTNLAEMEELWADQVQRLTLRLVVQGPLADIFDGISYQTGSDLLVADTPTALADLYADLLADLPSDPVAALAQWEAWAPLLGAMADGMRRADANLVRSDYIAAQLLRAMDGVVQPLDFAALAGALGIANLRVGTSAAETLSRNGADGTAVYVAGGGNDTLQGGSGQDVYIFGRQIGAVTIADEEAKAAGDRIRFAFLNPADVKLARDGNDLLITVVATQETVRIVGQFAPVTPLSSDVLLSSNKGIEDIQFADGTIYEIPQIMSAVGTGTDGNDHMTGTMHSDVFIGGLGNDGLEGGDDADLYVVHSGDGQDVIRDVQTTPLLRAADMLVFGDAIAPENVSFTRTGANDDDLLITIGVTGQSVLIADQFAYSVLGYNDKLAPNSRIEVFGFKHFGDNWSHKQIQQQLIATATTKNADTVTGFGDDDEFAASAGSDTLIGLDGQDRYHWGKGSGNDTIDERARFIDVNVGLGGLTLGAKADTVVFAAGIAASDLVFSRLSSAPNLTITLAQTGETLTIKDQFAGFQTGALGAQWFDRIEWFEFADGSRLSWQDVLLDITTGTSGDDSLWGDLYQDTLTGGLGNDYLSGGGYADTYGFNAGDGQDVVEDNNQFILGEGFVTIDTTPDVLRLGAGITPADITISYNADDITLVIGNTGDRVTLKGQNDYYHTGVFGEISNSRIERIEFANGEVWTWQLLNQRAIASATTAGNDVTVGFDLEDRLEASAGNDVLRGGDSGDTYVFGLGSGSDRIEETVSNANFDDTDRVEFAAGVTVNDVTFERSGKDLIVRIAGASDVLTIAGQFNNYVGFTNNDIESFHFANGAVITKAEVMARLTIGTSGNDTITGFNTDDTLIGGTGNDQLHGMDGADRYVFNLGDGHDTIHESVEFANIDDTDRIVFGAGILPSNVTLSRTGGALTLSINGTSDSITINGQFDFSSWYSWNDVELFEFADGTIWSKRNIADRLMGGTPGDDTLTGTFENDELNGREGNDVLRGGDGSDIYYFGRGHGQDTIEETISNANLPDFDQIVMGDGVARSDLAFSRSGDALTIAITGTADRITVAGQFDNYIGFSNYDIEQIQFADGTFMTKADIQALLTVGTSANETIVGFHTDDFLNGGGGNDILHGLDGSDTYFFGRGSGNDIVRESVEFVGLDDTDRIRFASDIAPADVVWSRSGMSLVIGLVGSSDTITIENGLDNEGSTLFTWRDVEFFEFSNGLTLTLDAIRPQLLLGTDGNDTIDGFHTADVLTGKLGSDTLRGAEGSDSLDGGAGDDILSGGQGSDIIIGGLGDDTLSGDEGNDVFRFARGDGRDVISEFSGNFENGTGGYDVLEFAAGILPSDVTVSQANSGADIILQIVGTTDQITLRETITDPYDQVEAVRFADGTIWTSADLVARATGATPGNDTIYGSHGSEVLAGGAGNDTLIGRYGNDILIGGPGNDTLYGDGDSDTFRFERGDGQDTIWEWSGDFWNGTGGFDTVEFGAGIAPADVIVTQFNGEHIRLQIAGTSDEVVIAQALNSEYERNQVEQIKFADGTVWDRANFVARSMTPTAGDDAFYGSHYSETIEGGAGNDSLIGRWGDDTLIGGTGNDTLYGDGGNDIFRFNRGDGQDTIYEWSGNFWNGSGGHDAIEFGEGISPGDIIVTQIDGANIRLGISGTTDQIVIGDEFNNDRNRVEQVRFADGSVWDWAEILARSMTPTPGDDLMFGTDGADVIAGGTGQDTLIGRWGDDTVIGGQGDDMLHGDGGDDTFVFNRGDGHDVISEYSGNGGSGGFDTLKFGAGILASDLVVSQGDGGRDLVVGIVGTTDQVTLKRAIVDGVYQIEQFQFADGTLWDLSEILAHATGATPGNDILYGSDNNDVLSGGAGDDSVIARGGDDILIGGTGNDRLEGWSGNDVYRFARGDGQDVIYDDYRGYWEWDLWDGGSDRIEFATGILPEDVSVTESGANTLILKINGTADQITLSNVVSDSRNRIEEVGFFNGVIWSHGDLMARALVATSGNDAFYAGYTTMDLSGAEGDDLLSGSGGAEQLDGGPGNDTVRANGGDDAVIGASGADYLNGGDGNDVVTGGTGNDRLEGWSGNDVYRFARGDGQDVIYDDYRGYWEWDLWDGGNDRVEFADGIAPEDVSVVESGANTLILKINGTTDQITLSNVVSDSRNRIEEVRFANGVTWTHADLMAKALAPTDGDDVFYTGYTTMNVDGGSGNDTLTGSGGPEKLDGGSGNDFLRPSDGNDILVGGTGNDRLEGWSGNDVYRFARGDGQDVIYDDYRGYWEWDLWDGGSDRIEFATGILPEDVSVTESGANTLILKINGTADQITLSNVVSDSRNRIEEVRFANGTVWSHADMMAKALVATDGNDAFYAGYTTMNLSGGAGNDTLYGSGGAETIDGGDGNDTINAGGGDDIVIGGAGDDYVQANDGADVVTGGAGNDRLEGWSGNDVYRFARGDGQDVIYDDYRGYWEWDLWDGGNDRLEFAAGIAPEDVSVVESGANTLILKINGTADQITLSNVVSDSRNRIEEVRFANGVIWSHADMMAKAIAPAGVNNALVFQTSPADMQSLESTPIWPFEKSRVREIDHAAFNPRGLRFEEGPHIAAAPLTIDSVTWLSSESLHDPIRRSLDLPLSRVALNDEDVPAHEAQSRPLHGQTLDEGARFASGEFGAAARLSLLRQDMAAFGAISMDAVMLERRHGATIQEWFA